MKFIIIKTNYNIINNLKENTPFWLEKTSNLSPLDGDFTLLFGKRRKFYFSLKKS